MDITKKTIQYLGVSGTPTTMGEVRVEIAGLRHVVKVAEEMICRLEQAVAIMEMKREEMLNDRLQAKGTGPEADPGPAAKDASINSETEKGGQEGI
jgi:hypothetical protein